MVQNVTTSERRFSSFIGGSILASLVSNAIICDELIFQKPQLQYMSIKSHHTVE